MQLETYRTEAQDFLEGYVQARNDAHAGLSEAANLEEVFARHEGLFSAEAIAELLAVHEGAAGEAKKRTRFLVDFAVSHALDRAVHDQDVAIAGQLATSDYHALAVRLTNEEDAGERRAVRDQMAAAQAATDEARIERLRRLHEVARELTGMPYLECRQFLQGSNFHLLRRQVEAFLAASADRYRRDLELFAARMLGGMRAEEVSAADVRFLLRGKEYDQLFPEGQLLSVLKRTLFGIGIDLKKQTNIRIDADERKGKHSDAACFGIRVPERIYLVLRPHGGLKDCLALLRKAGRALHLGHIRPDAAFEYKYLGDDAVGETYGTLFQYLTLNPEWLQDLLGLAEAGELIQYVRFRKLFWLRCYAARFLFEMELHCDAGYDAAQLKARYAEQMSQTLGFEVGGEDFLADTEDPFWGTSALRAWIFEAELRQTLEERYGRRWYSRPAAGSFLKDLWSFGTKYTVEELAKHIRLMELDLEPIKRDLT